MNPRSYPRGPRYRVSARPRPEDAPRRRKPWFAIAGGAVALVAVGAVLVVLLLPSFRSSPENQETGGTAMDAARPRDFAPTPLFMTPTPYPSPLSTATPRPIPTADPSLTTAELASIIMFANSIMFLERRQRNLIRDYRYYDIDLLTRWIGDSVEGAEELLDRQRNLLAEYRKIRTQDVEGAEAVLELYVEATQESVATFERLIEALGPLYDAGTSVVVGIRTGMLPNIGVSRGLSRSAMIRMEGREGLEVIVNRAGLTLGDVEWLRSPDAEDL